MSKSAENKQLPTTNHQVDFGYRKVSIAQKQNLVNDVFNSVAPSYDIMNDLMSLGVHRLWKETLLDWMAPRPNQVLADLAGGTGDIALRFVQRGGQFAYIIDINQQMLASGQKRKVMENYKKKLNWFKCC